MHKVAVIAMWWNFFLNFFLSWPQLDTPEVIGKIATENFLQEKENNNADS